MASSGALPLRSGDSIALRRRRPGRVRLAEASVGVCRPLPRSYLFPAWMPLMGPLRAYSRRFCRGSSCERFLQCVK